MTTQELLEERIEKAELINEKVNIIEQELIDITKKYFAKRGSWILNQWDEGGYVLTEEGKIYIDPLGEEGSIILLMAMTKKLAPKKYEQYIKALDEQEEAHKKISILYGN